MARFHPLFLFPCLALACSHAPELARAPTWDIAHASNVDTFRVAGQSDYWGVRVTNDEILGVQPDFALQRTSDGIQGRAVGVPVAVRFEDTHGEGTYRAAPFSIFVQRTEDGLHAQGLMGGYISNFDLTPDRLVGKIGPCGWDLSWDGTVYAGSRGCGRRIDKVSIELPATMAGWSDAQVAGALGLLLNVGGPLARADRLADNSAEYRTAPVPDPGFSAGTRSPTLRAATRSRAGR
jgi:hypothetical protein